MKQWITSKCDGIEFSLCYESDADPKDGIPAVQVVRAILTHHKIKEAIANGNYRPEPEASRSVPEGP